MRNILVTAYYSMIKYLRNPLAIIAFVAAPILIVFTLTGSTQNNFNVNVSSKDKIRIENVMKNNVYNHDNKLVGTNEKAAMASMFIFLFYGAVLSSNLILQDLKNGINKRLKTFPISSTEILLGKFIGSVVVMSVFASIIVILTKCIFNINWNGNPFAIGLAILLFIITANSFGIVVTGILKNIYICALIALGVNFSMVYTVFAEAYSPVKLTGINELFNKISLHNYAVKAIVGSISSNSTAVNNSLEVLFFSALFMLFIAIIVGRKVLK